MPDVTISDDTEVFFWVETSPNNPNGVRVETTSKDGGTTVAVLVAINASSFFNSLFGSGHAGSCGAFRDAYKETRQEALNVFGEFNQQAQQFLGQNSVTGIQPTQFVSEYLDAIVNIDRAIDRGFDEFRGRNLLGQTMYHDRFNGWMQRNVLAPLMFFTNDYLWEWTRRAFFERQDFDHRIRSNDLCCQFNSNQINQLFGAVQPIAQMQQDIQTNRQNLDNVRFASIPNILDQIGSINQLINSSLSPAIQRLTTDVQRIFTAEIPRLDERINVNQTRLNRLGETYATIQSLNNVKAQLRDQINANRALSKLDDQALRGQLLGRINEARVHAEARLQVIKGQLLAADQAIRNSIQSVRNDLIAREAAIRLDLAQNLATAVGQLRTELLEQFQADLNNLRSQFQGEIDSLQAELDSTQADLAQTQTDLAQLEADTARQIAEIRQQDIPELRAELEAQLDTLQNTLESVDQELRDGIQLINAEIQDTIIPTLGFLQSQITELLELITDTVLPSIADNLQSIVQLDILINQDLLPRIGQNELDIQSLRDIIQLEIRPRLDELEICCSTHTDQITQIFNVELPNILLVILNLRNDIINIIVADCQRVRECVQQNFLDDLNAVCEFGRRAFGIMRECWSDDQTPADQNTDAYPVDPTTPEGLNTFLQEVLQPASGSDMALIQAQTLRTLDQVLNRQFPTLEDFPSVEDIPFPDFLYAPIPAP